MIVCKKEKTKCRIKHWHNHCAIFSQVNPSGREEWKPDFFTSRYFGQSVLVNSSRLSNCSICKHSSALATSNANSGTESNSNVVQNSRNHKFFSEILLTTTLSKDKYKLCTDTIFQLLACRKMN